MNTISRKLANKYSYNEQALCEELKENSNEEILTILTGVNRRVAFAKQSYHYEYELDASKQMPIIQSMLTKGFYFLKRTKKNQVLEAQSRQINLNS